ncbi:hypothetical protein HJC23_013151 [Cyclotella cryptica]|uniref:Glycolipid transfer protein domain-containing protein n=1 Tax=Cyclotella cryptica TaxID=29204 RepID=A0ABD3QNZ6_9STRA
MRRHRALNIPFLLLLCRIGECIASESAISQPNRPSTTFPYFLRGGSTATATVTRTKTRQRQRSKPRRGPQEFVVGVQRLTTKFQNDASRQWTNLQANAKREWDQFLADLPRIRPHTFQSHSKLDEVCKSFSSVLTNNNGIDTAQLLKACRAHLAFIKSAGSSLRLVAKDLEGNLAKAEKLFHKSPEACRHLSTLLELERSTGIHQGNVLKDPSAAIGLLWIRRSLAFQADLYASFLESGIHPRDAAMSSYTKHLRPYHGWALSKLFSASLSQMPEREAFIAKFGGVDMDELTEECDADVKRKLKTLVDAWDPLLSCWKEDFERMGLEDTRKV